MTSAKNQECLLSLCMIVRDNESIIRDCLESIRPWVDEMIVVDTGSVDQTPQIAKELGAKVYEFPWCDDFSAARNESLKHATGEWVFWMDSDDTISEENGQGLFNLVREVHALDTLAFVMQVHCPGGPDAPGDKTVVDHVKLFRNRPEIRFEGRIHEQVLQDIRKLNGEVKFTDLYVTHSGSDHSTEGKKRKVERDLRCLELDLEERPDHPFVLFNLGMTYADIEEYEQAADWLNKCLSVSAPHESHVRKAYALLVNALYQLKQNEQACQTCQRAIELYPEDPELRFRMGIVQHALGNHQLSVDAYRSALRPKQGERYFSSLDPAITGYKARHNLALVYLDLNREDLAELQWRQAIEQAPTFRHAWRKLAELLMRTGKTLSAEVLLEQMREVGPVLDREIQLLEGMLSIKNEDHEIAIECFNRSLAAEKDPIEVSELISKYLFHHGRLEDAADALRRHIELTPTEGANWHNLGLVYRNMGDLDQAEYALRQSLELRPDSHVTIQMLEDTIHLRDSKSETEPQPVTQ